MRIRVTATEARPAYRPATAAWWCWGALLLIALGAGAACSKDDGRFSTPATPGREVALIAGGASLEMRASFLDGELIFWQHHDRADVLAAFLERPFGARPTPRLIELSDHPQAVTAAADAAGQICLVSLRYDEGGLSTITARVSGNRGVSWSPPQLVHRELGEPVIFDSDSLVPGRPGEWFVLVRYRLGLAPKGQLF